LSCIENMSKYQWWAVPALRVYASRHAHANSPEGTVHVHDENAPASGNPFLRVACVYMHRFAVSVCRFAVAGATHLDRFRGMG
jgi:hypothetical protein